MSGTKYCTEKTSGSLDGGHCILLQRSAVQDRISTV